MSNESALAPQAAELVRRVQSRTSPVEIIYRSHELWPLPPPPKCAAPNARRLPLRISVLDSSFNPPTLAHLALIRSLPPRESNVEDYDARLLLLSVRNADKALKPGDASYEQRLEMMVRLAHELQSTGSGSASDPNPPNAANVAVAIIDEPTFIRKSSVLRSFLLEHHHTLLRDRGEKEYPVASSTNSQTQEIQLTFLMGFDTLERFLAPRYYVPSDPATFSGGNEDAEHFMLAALKTFFAAPPTGNGSRVICAYRSISSPAGPQIGTVTTDREIAGDNRTILLAKRFETNQFISFIHLPEGVGALSSSEVRSRISKELNWKHIVIHEIALFIEKQSLYVSVATVI
ncbi:Nucleotidylyl transferase [Schizopora paradoxa]|uniref:Nucleotidylyl transferase n=1 Tax=Schizopora paradoxa TaxID=27342 RepID=A0A0H2R8E6_9AGAM|nr:Nucleotidylyl transferase [Schizopora paradoxa]